MEYEKLDKTITSSTDIDLIEDFQTFCKLVDGTKSNYNSSVKLLDSSYMHSDQK